MSEPAINLEQADVKAEMDAQEWYDILPIEKKLMGWSLGLGCALLAVFVVIFRII